MAVVSIIIPVYKVEKYLDKCIGSIKQQTFKDFECILVDDGSPDQSGKMCDEYSAQDSRFVVIHKKNEGPSIARQTACNVATGKYLCFVDSDDWIEPDTLELLVEEAEKTSSQIVICDYFKELKESTQVVSYVVPKDKDGSLNSFPKKAGYMNYLWNKLFLREFFNQIQFPNNINLCEDLLITFNLYFLADKVSQVYKPLYHYNKTNESSVTLNYNVKSYEDRLFVTKEIIKLFEKYNLQKQYETIINFYKLYTKLMLILFPQLHNERLWKETYPEANKYIWSVPLRFDYKILSWLCSMNMFKLAYLIQKIKK